MVRCTEACIDPKQCQYPRNLTLVDLRTPIGLAPLDFSSSAPRDLPIYMQKMIIIT
jgi:hypothetical protein